jgi:hypothetical protein
VIVKQGAGQVCDGGAGVGTCVGTTTLMIPFVQKAEIIIVANMMAFMVYFKNYKTPSLFISTFIIPINS